MGSHLIASQVRPISSNIAKMTLIMCFNLELCASKVNIGKVLILLEL
jgi:hypothetical protein